MKSTRQPKGKRIELDAEVIADLEVDESDRESLRGGRSSSGNSIVGSIAGSVST